MLDDTLPSLTIGFFGGKSLKFKKWIFHKYQECTRTKKSKNLIFHTYQQSTRTSILGQMLGDSLKNMFDSLGFAYDFAFCRNNGSLKIFQNVLWNKSFNDANRYQSFFFRGGDPQQNIKKKGSGGSRFEKCSKFQKVEIWKNNMF